MSGGSLRRFLGGSSGIIVGTAVMNVCTFGFTMVAAGAARVHGDGATRARDPAQRPSSS